MSELAWTGLFSVVLTVGVGVGELLRKLGASSDTTRRLVHAFTGVTVAVGVAASPSTLPFYLLGAAFIVVNGVALARGFFPSMHAVGRHSYGTVIFPLGLLVAQWGCWTVDPHRKWAITVAFLVLGLADPAAALVGMRWGGRTRIGAGAHAKSVVGSLTFLVVAMGLVLGGLWLANPFPQASAAQVVAVAFTVACVATGAELMGRDGWDNLFIVLAVTAPLAVLGDDFGRLSTMLGALGLALAFGALSFRLRFLEESGTVAASLLAFCVVGLGGAHWAVPGFTFFFLSSVLSKAGKKRKALAVQAEKGSRRDVGQVLANGGVGWGLLVASAYLPSPWFYWGFLGSFAAAAADTWASEIGTYFRGPTWSIITLKPVPPGVSGGVSVSGTLGAAAGSASVGLAAVLVPAPGPLPLSAAATFALVVASGVVGSLVDSVLGATLQAQYRTAADELTEKRESAGQPNTLVRGAAWFDNDAVNVACTVAGGALGLVALLLG